MDDKRKDPLRPKEDVRITDKEKGFLNTLKNIVHEDSTDVCPDHNIKGQLIPPPKPDGKDIHYTFKCPKGHTFHKVVPMK